MADYGLGIGLSGKLSNVERMDEAQRNRDFKELAAKGAAQAKQKEAAQKTYDDWSKLIANNNPKILPVYSQPANDISTKLVADMTEGYAKNPLYMQTPEFQGKYMQFKAQNQLLEQSSEIAKRAMQIRAEHPNDYDMPDYILEAINTANHPALVAGISKRLKELDPSIQNANTDMLTPDMLLIEKPNWDKQSAAIQALGDSPNTRSVRTRIKDGRDQRGDFTEYQESLVYDKDAINTGLEQMRNIWNSDPRRKQYDKTEWDANHKIQYSKVTGNDAVYETKAGSNFNFGTETNPTGNVAVEEVKNPDGSVDYSWTGTGLTTEVNQVLIPRRYSTAVDDKGKVTDGYIIKGVRLKYFPEQNAVQFHGQYYDLKGRPLEVTDDKKIMYDLDNVNDEQVKILKNVSANTNNTLSFANGKPEVVGGKTSMLREYKVYDNKGKEAPAKKESKAAPAKKGNVTQEEYAKLKKGDKYYWDGVEQIKQ